MEGNGRPPQYPHTHNNYHVHFDPDQPPPHHHHQHHPHSHPQPHHPSSSSPQLHPIQDAHAWHYDYIHSPQTASPTSYAWPTQPAQYVPNLSPDVHQPSHPQHYLQQPYQTTTPAAAFPPSRQTPYYLNPVAPTPHAYHASPHQSAYPSPVSRSMSVSAVSTTGIERLASNLPRQSQQRSPQQQSTTTFLPTPRQIRFVSTDGQPHAKRRRINAACLTCRKRKTRCSGERPVCKTCTDNGHKCAGYAEKPSRKDAAKKPDDGDGDDDDDGDTPPSSPRKPRIDHGAGSQKNSSRSFATDRGYQGQQYPLPEPPSRNLAISPPVDRRSPMSAYTAGSGSVSAGRTRVPFFRYFGPTAIVPGFKQMVVQMKDGREYRRSHNSISSESPASGPQAEGSIKVAQEITPVPVNLPYYDATDPSPNAALITHLCKIFFVHLGCNYPFLQRERFLKDLEEKRVDAILVNAVCAVAARFSADKTLAQPSDDSLPLDSSGCVRRAFRGQPFAQRAMSAVMETFSCPTLAVTQACLLLAYEEFGSDRDSGLWMYLGTSIRMAQDLGIQKLEGLQLEGRLGPTPKTAKGGDAGKLEERKRAEQQNHLTRLAERRNGASLEDRKASEQERIDTFWAVFFLDRAVSSGVGRPVTLRDKDIEISFPYRAAEAHTREDPDPFPAMIRIVHMYGRVADVLNNIKDVTEVTPEVLKRLADMEKDLTGIYQKLSSKLHFNATNFQHYVKAGQGTNFILLHFWFHTLIVLLHQPTLLHSFEGRIQQLFTDSKELSMSSAKTIADILAFAELIDVKSFIGNPFTSQPMYVAACAFLAEAAAHASQPPSRGDSPFESKVRSDHLRKPGEREAEQRMAAKHSLLASAANQNYQRCYKALKTLYSYWAGCRYILVALDQKSKGLASPLLFTSEDVDGEMPSTEPSFTTPGWRRSSFAASLGGPALDRMRIGRGSSQDLPWSPKLDFSNAIGWSITGTGNSPAPNFSFLYQNATNDSEPQDKQSGQEPSFHAPTLHEGQHIQHTPAQRPSQLQSYEPSSALLVPDRGRASSLPYDPTNEGDPILGLQSPYSVRSWRPAPGTSNPVSMRPQTFGHSPNTSLQDQQQQRQQHSSFYPGSATTNLADMFIEAQEVDMSAHNSFNLNDLPFSGTDMIPWLEYLPQDVLNYFGDSSEADLGSSADGQPMHDGLLLPRGLGPPSDPSALMRTGDHDSSTGRYTTRRQNEHM